MSRSETAYGSSPEVGAPRPEPANGFDCVFLSPSPRDFRTVSRLLEPARIRVHHAASLRQADALLTATGAPVLLGATACLDGSWIDANHMLTRLHPTVVQVVVADDADEKFRIDVLEHGVYDLILKPFFACELRRILESARAHAGCTGFA